MNRILRILNIVGPAAALIIMISLTTANVRTLFIIALVGTPIGLLIGKRWPYR